MSSKTTLVARQVQLRQWADQIRACNNRQEGLTVADWCDQNSISKSCYYYRLKRVRQACLDAVSSDNVTFVELPHPVGQDPAADGPDEIISPSAVIRCKEGFSIEIMESASHSFLKDLIGAVTHAE